jgi:ABC-2 type transport system ATP-binding protein
MRLKLALASALSFRPKLLVLDEPFSGLDALTRDEMIGEFLREPREMSILISSHELDEVERLCTDVAFLDEGRLLFQGTLPELREKNSRQSLRTIFVSMVSAARAER